MVADPGVIDPGGIPARGFSANVIRTRSCRIPRSVPQPIPRVRLRRASAPRCTLITPCCPHTVPPRLIYIPLVLAGWLRYQEGVDDNGSEVHPSPDANIEHVRALMGNPKLGDDVSEAQLYPLLANRYYFGVNLFEIVA